ncbi:unnamed protein product [Durusdinium trenchii]|uniref:Uncharacterized protein n=2 Tax=Durusdinium trenchii TaxID=1381693 RepID=A0ABP0MC33_9DINO
MAMAVALPPAHVPIVLPVPPGAVKVMPRWAEEDEVSKWRVKYRLNNEKAAEDPDSEWIELELRHFTRELPLSNLPPGVHHFRVAIETPDGWSDWSPPVECEPPPPQVPSKLASLLCEVLGVDAVKVRWSPPLDTATTVAELQVLRYKILVSWLSDDEPMTREILVEEATDFYVVTGLVSLTDYTFQISAENCAGWSEWSEPSTKQTEPPVPKTLNQPTLRRSTHHSAVIQWQHPPFTDVPVDSFSFRHTTSADWSGEVVEITDVSPSLSQYVITGLRPGQVYIFQVRAVNRYGKGIWSEGSIPIRTTDGSIPAKIETLKASDIYQSFIRLKWAPVDENGYPITGYLLRYAHEEDMAEATEAVPRVVRDNGFDSCDIRHLRKLKYYFQAAAINQLGIAEWSNAVMVDMSK